MRVREVKIVLSVSLAIQSVTVCYLILSAVPWDDGETKDIIEDIITKILFSLFLTISLGMNIIIMPTLSEISLLELPSEVEGILD